MNHRSALQLAFFAPYMKPDRKRLIALPWIGATYFTAGLAAGHLLLRRPCVVWVHGAEIYPPNLNVTS